MATYPTYYNVGNTVYSELKEAHETYILVDDDLTKYRYPPGGIGQVTQEAQVVGFVKGVCVASVTLYPEYVFDMSRRNKLGDFGASVPQPIPQDKMNAALAKVSAVMDKALEP